MLLGGDELGRTQRGNNNAYCQDNETSWFDWQHVDEALLAYVRRVIAMRRAHPVLRRRRYLADPGYSVWFAPDGQVMSPAMWEDPGRHSVAVFVDGSVAPDHDRWGEPLVDRNLLVLVNGEADAVEFRVPDTSPPGGSSGPWRLELDTSVIGPQPTSTTFVRPGETTLVPARSLLVHWSAGDPAH
jgi:glycogen operon protein